MRYEEIDVQDAGTSGGWNFGWRRMEGNAAYPAGSTLPPPRHYHRPLFVYPHNNGRCAIVGGYVYRGTNIPSLDGAYLFSDNCNGAIHALNRVNGKTKGQRILDCPTLGDPTANCSVDAPSSFGEDADGELYILTLTGELLKIDAAT
jgi:hypothetical protein